MMTIELSLRRRAVRARCFAALWLVAAIALLAGTFLMLPSVANNLLLSVIKIDGPPSRFDPTPTKADPMATKPDPTSPKKDAAAKESTPEQNKPVVTSHVFTLTVLGFGVAAIGFAAYLLSRAAMFEAASAARLSGTADALCLAGSKIEDLEKLAPIFAPPANLEETRIGSSEETKLLTDVLKHAKA
jgi:hypothetical protein